MNKIEITKLENGNYVIKGPHSEELLRLEEAVNVITEVRKRLNLLGLPLADQIDEKIIQFPSQS